MAVEIYVKSVDLGAGQLRFDVYGKNLPGNLLGLAGDLQFVGDLAGFSYQKIEIGDVFKDGSENGKLPILMASPNWGSGKLIIGLTQRADQMVKVLDGKIFSVYFKGAGKLQFSAFDKQVLSVYDGKRVDLKTVNWINQEQWLVQVASAKAVSKEKSSLVMENEQLETDLIQTVNAEPLSAQLSLSEGVVFPFWWLIIGVLLVMGFVVVWFWLRRLKKSKFA